VALAQRLGSRRSRVVRKEGADPSVSLDLLGRALLVLGVAREELARLIQLSERIRAARSAFPSSLLGLPVLRTEPVFLFCSGSRAFCCYSRISRF
jgi:hypothetical protein